MASYDSLYFGKVIYDSDMLSEGDKRPYNRVKVLINGISPIEKESFNQPRGKNNPNTITGKGLKVVEQEFYAYVLQPVTGSGSGTKYNANKDILSVSDVGDIEDLNATPPAEAYAKISDNFVGGMGTGSAGVNTMAAAYSPDNRSNAYKGMMSLPGVGSTVVVSFIGGKRGMPIIVGILPSGADVDSIHGVGFRDEIYPNYPFAYSNLKGPDEVVEGGAAGAAAGANATAGVVGPDGTTATAVRDDYSDIPPDKAALWRQLPPEEAAGFASRYRAQEREMAEIRAEDIALIREVRGDAAADRAAAQLRAR